jgi:hypothetical protein
LLTWDIDKVLDINDYNRNYMGFMRASRNYMGEDEVAKYKWRGSMEKKMFKEIAKLCRKKKYSKNKIKKCYYNWWQKIN